MTRGEAATIGRVAPLPEPAVPARLRAVLEFEHDGGLHTQPALDGLRGLAVAAVVAFHGGFDVAGGGYLGVSLFFTLSGFLITSLLLAEVRHHGRVDLVGFWSRRFRRLLPAAWATLVVVGIVEVAVGDVSPELPGDLWAAAGQVANWRFLLGGQSYADLFSAPTPVLHFWSLAIEEQFYLLFPLVFAGLWRLGRGRRSALGWCFVAGATASFLLPVLLGFGVDRAYYGTDTRAGELLVGAALAVAMSQAGFRRRIVHRWWWRNAVAAGGVLALAASVAGWVLLEEGTPVLTQGLLAAVSLASALAILGAVVPAGPVHHLLSVRPLRFLGRISYGVYLFHWPLLVWTGANRPGDDHLARFALVVVATLALAWVSHQLLEMPIRRGRVSVQALRPVAVVGVVALAFGPVAVGGQVEPARQVLADLEEASLGTPLALPGPPASSPATAGSTPTTLPTTPAVPERPVVSFFGDSIMLSLAMGLGWWNGEDVHYRSGNGVARLGCGVLSGGTMRYDRVRSFPDECDDWEAAWPFVVRAVGTDVSVVMSCQWETVDRRLPGRPGLERLGEPAYDAAVLAGYQRAVDLLVEAGTDLVVWVDCPRFSQRVGTRSLEPGLRASRDPARVARLNELVGELAASRPDHVRVLRWSEWVDARSDDARIRPDGSHFAWKQDTGVAAEFGPRLLAVVDEFRRESAAG